MRTASLFITFFGLLSTTFGQGGSVIRIEPGEAPITQAFIAPSFASGGNLTLMSSILPDDPLGLLQRPQIQKEVELTDDQKTIVRELQQDIQRQMGEIFQSQAKFGGDARRLMGEATKAIRKNVAGELANILEPKQVRRLGELEVQMKIKKRGVLALLDDKLSSKLEISDEQETDIKKRQRESQKELMEAIEKLRAKHRDGLIKEVLSEEQLSRLEKMSGDDYHVKKPNWRRQGVSR